MIIEIYSSQFILFVIMAATDLAEYLFCLAVQAPENSLTGSLFLEIAGKRRVFYPYFTDVSFPLLVNEVYTWENRDTGQVILRLTGKEVEITLDDFYNGKEGLSSKIQKDGYSIEIVTYPNIPDIRLHRLVYQHFVDHTRRLQPDMLFIYAFDNVLQVSGLVKARCLDEFKKAWNAIYLNSEVIKEIVPTISKT